MKHNIYYTTVLLIIVVSTITVGCGRSSGLEGEALYRRHQPPKEVERGFGYDDFYVQEIEGCEYIVYQGHGYGNIIHKQNCKWCAQHAKVRASQGATNER